MSTHQPTELDLKKDRGLTVRWSDGTGSFYSIALLRRMSPSADMRELRDEMHKNPLTVLPSGPGEGQSLTATNAELVGNYAIRIEFSDGHRTGLFTWDYLRELDPTEHTAPDARAETPHSGLTRSDEIPDAPPRGPSA